jgi:hypothetical protein
LPVGVVILIGAIASFCAFIQALLMLFRDGSVLILAAVTPLAASGSFANATNGWKNKVLSWQLALIFYKPLAAMVYAAMIWLTNAGTGVVEGVAPLAGPAAPVVQGAAQVVRTGAQMANSAANCLADAADNSIKDGSK